MVKKRFIYLFVFTSLVLFLTLSFCSAWILNGTVYDVNGNALNNTNISVAMIASGGALTILSTNSTASNASGWFNLMVHDNSSYMYAISLTHRNSSTGAVDFIGQSLPYFPYQQVISNITNVNFYLKQAGTMNITVINKTGVFTNGFAVQIKDTKLGYPLTCSGWIASGANNYICNAPLERNYSIMVYPSSGGGENFVPVSFSWTNFSSSDSYNVPNRNGINLSTYNGTIKTLHKAFNVTESFARITGYLQNSSGADFADWVNFTVVPFLLEPGNMIFMTYGMLPWNASAWNSQSDIYNSSSGFYNISVPYSPTEIVNYLFFAAGQNSSFYGSYKNITITGNTQVNFTMYGLLGTEAIINMSGSTEGSYAVNTKRQRFNLVNSTNSTLSDINAHIEMKLDYSSTISGLTSFTFMEEISSGAATFTLPLLNISGFKETNIYSQTYEPKRVSGRTASQISANNNFTLATFTPQGIGTNFTSSSITISAYKSNSTCDVPNPASPCLLTSFTHATAQQNMFPIVVGGGAISLRISYGSVSVHYANVDLLASGPPSADFENNAGSNEASSGFSNAAKFGSSGPTIYDYVLVAIPYLEGSSSQTGLNESAQVNLTIPTFYDEDYNTPIWNSSNGTSAAGLMGNYSHYSTYQAEWQILMNSNNSCYSTSTGNSSINFSVPCHIQTGDNKIWVRLPHFSGTEPTATGSVITASSSADTPGSGGTSDTSWTVSFISPTASQLEAGYNVLLGKKWRNAVKIGNETHHVGVIDINSSTSKVVINVSSKPQQAIFSIGDEKKFEVTGDNYYDIMVRLNGIDTISRANITIKTIREMITSQAVNTSITQTGSSGGVVETESEESSSLKTIILIVIMVLIVIVIGAIVYNLVKNRRYKLRGY